MWYNMVKHQKKIYITNQIISPKHTQTLGEVISVENVRQAIRVTQH